MAREKAEAQAGQVLHQRPQMRGGKYSPREMCAVLERCLLRLVSPATALSYLSEPEELL